MDDDGDAWIDVSVCDHDILGVKISRSLRGERRLEDQIMKE